MCYKITLILAAVFVAHIVSRFMPNKSHWKFQGRASPNSTFEWLPDHSVPQGMIFIHMLGNGTVTFDKHTLKLDGHRFIHVFGDLPTIYYAASSTPAKAQVHLITDI